MTAYTYHPMCEIKHTFPRKHEVGTQSARVTLFLPPSE